MKVHKYKDIPDFDHSRFLSRITVDEESGCWIAKMKIRQSAGKKTYPVFNIGGKEYYAHRVSYHIFKKLDNSLVVDHICRNKLCVNPCHLRNVNTSVNALENNISFYALNKAKTHCKHGHEFNNENTILVKKGRGCRSCAKIRNRKTNDNLLIERASRKSAI